MTSPGAARARRPSGAAWAQGLALVGGGLLFGVARQAPFTAAAAVLALSVAVFAWRAHVRGRDRGGEGTEPASGVARELWDLLSQRPRLRAYLLANALWELSLGALKTFVVLYITAGLGYSIFASSAIVGGVALVVLVAAPLTGRAADRFGPASVTRVALPLYGGPAGPGLRDHGSRPGVALAADRLRRRRDHDAAIRDVDSAHARGRARRAHRLLQPEPRRRRVLGPLLASAPLLRYVSCDGRGALETWRRMLAAGRSSA